MSQFSRQVHGPSKTKGSGNGKRKIKFKDKRRSNAGNYFSATKLAASDVAEPGAGSYPDMGRRKAPGKACPWPFCRRSKPFQT